MPRILCFGDTHEDIETQERIMSREDVDITICTGDIERYKSSPVPFFFVPGNHDIDMHEEILENIRKGHIQLDNWHYLTPGKVVLDPFPIAGLGGNYAPSDYDRKRRELKAQRHFTKEEVEVSKNLKPHPYLFISHEAPYSVGDEVKGDHYGVEPIFEILKSLRPKFMVSGHIHSRQIESYRGTIAINIGDGSEGEYVIIDTDSRQIEFWDESEKSRTFSYE